jgi:hypothetical protein
MGATVVTATVALVDGTAPRVSFGGLTGVYATVAGSASYATGGDSISLVNLGLAQVRRAFVLADVANNSGWSTEIVVTNPSAPLLKLYVTDAVEVTAAVDVSGHTPTILFLGV